MTRLEKLIEFIEEKLEVDYGYMPRNPLREEDMVDEYIQDIKDDFEAMRENNQFVDSGALNESIIILEGLDDI